jgi:protoporphyrin/coproporphyrin ferrochelatase
VLARLRAFRYGCVLESSGGTHVVRYVGDAWSHDSAGRVGVLLVNLGTPAAPTPGAVRRYLAEFLRDPRVVELPRFVWWLLLYGVILPLRAGRVARAYRKVWMAEGSPLRVYSERQRDALVRVLAERLRDRCTVDLGMRYGEPSIAGALERLRAARAHKLLVLPLYPQYCSATTGSVYDAVGAQLERWRWVPALRIVDHYHDEPGYVSTLANTVREHWARQPPAERLLFSFHGIPRRSMLAGDPYYCQCLKTARLVAEALELPEERWAVGFQSRLGRAEWLQPYTVDLLAQWARAGTGDVDVVCPGFSADCLETLEEIAIRYEADFRRAGGRALHYVPALNDRADHIEFLADLVVRNVHGWPEAAAPESPSTGVERTRRASALGALH